VSCYRGFEQWKVGRFTGAGGRLTNGKPAPRQTDGGQALHCSAPEQSTISLILALRNGGLPKRWADIRSRVIALSFLQTTATHFQHQSPEISMESPLILNVNFSDARGTLIYLAALNAATFEIAAAVLSQSSGRSVKDIQTQWFSRADEFRKVFERIANEMDQRT
jgi:hypothetical protein